jgi:hypothetical protein
LILFSFFVSVLATPVRRPSLSFQEILSQTYQSKPDWRNVLQAPPKPLYNLELKWVGREEEVKKMETIISELLSSLCFGYRNAQSFRLPIVFGAVGIGKTR